MEGLRCVRDGFRVAKNLGLQVFRILSEGTL